MKNVPDNSLFGVLTPHFGAHAIPDFRIPQDLDCIPLGLT